VHYFQFNIGDYASHTRHLSLMEDLAYRRLLDAYYLRESELPLCTIEVSRIISMRFNIEDVEQVLTEFFERTETGWFHKRAEAEIAHFRDKRQKASNAGKASAERRSNVRSTDVQPTNNHKPITNNQEPLIEPKGSSETGVSPVRPIEIVEAWNITAAELGLARVVKLTADRKRKLAARCKDTSLEEFQDALATIRRSRFLQGQNDRSWKADFDFFLQPKSLAKLIEGSYE
jgi:uncharacterized protein YdaU (DUF1376 family)